MTGPNRPAPAVIRILVADDHAVVRHGLRVLLDREPDLRVVAEAADGEQAVRLALAPDVDLAVLDIAMPRMTGLAAARELARLRPDLPILILSMYDSEQFLFEALSAGASGYVVKSAADQDIVAACRAASSGGVFLYPTAVTTLVREVLASSGSGPTRPAADPAGPTRPAGDPAGLGGVATTRDGSPGGMAEDGAHVLAGPAGVLTPREVEVVTLIAQGRSSRQIAAALSISVKTVDRHRTNILEKLGMHDRVQVTRYAIRAGLIQP